MLRRQRPSFLRITVRAKDAFPPPPLSSPLLLVFNFCLLVLFRRTAIFSRSNPLNLGVANLTIRLTDLLVRRIKTVLPVMKFEVQEMQAEAGRQLTLIGREAPTAPLERMNMLMKLVAEYCALLRNAVRGDYRSGILADKPNLRLRTIADKTFRILGDKIRETQPDFDSPVRF